MEKKTDNVLVKDEIKPSLPPKDLPVKKSTSTEKDVATLNVIGSMFDMFGSPG